MIHDVPGLEVPTGIYRLAWIAYVWLLIAAWLGFSGPVGTNLDLMFVTIIVTVLFALLILVRKTALRHDKEFEHMPHRADEETFDTFTGKVTVGEAYLQILLIPIALALAATLIVGVYVIQ